MMTNQPNESRPKTHSFEELIVWQKAHQLVLAVYNLTEKFPQKEVYGLTSQFRRAAVSIAANIAEGYKKYGRPDKLKFLNTAQGSLEECRYFLILTRDLGYGEITAVQPMLEDTSKLLEGYSGAIRRRAAGGVGSGIVLIASIIPMIHYIRAIW